MKRAGNIRSLIYFELLYKAAFLMLVFLGGAGIFRVLMKITGYSYLTPENLFAFLAHPITLLVFVVLLLIGSLIYLLESVSLLVFYQGFVKEKRVRVVQILFPGIRQTIYLLKRRGRWLLILFSVVNALISLIPILVACVIRIRVPASLAGQFAKLILFHPIIIVAIAALLLFDFLGLYMLYYCVLGEYSVLESYRLSVKLIKRHPFRFVWRMIGANLVMLTGCLIVFLAVLFGSCYLLYRIKPIEIQNAAMFAAYEQVVFYMGILIAIAGQITNYAVLSGYFARYGMALIQVNRIEKFQEQITYEEAEWQLAYIGRSSVLRRLHGKYTAIVAIVTVIVIGVNIFSIRDAFRNGTLAAHETLFGTYITSHRGASADAPENTLPALRLAIEHMADYAEIDVQETQDGVVVLMHDLSLNRTTGSDLLVSELTIEEIRNLEAGSWFSPEYIGTNVPTLEEVFELCKGQIALNIELKVNRSRERNQSLVTKVIELIEAYDMENQCVISSASLSVLEMVKEANEGIKTGYIISFAYGDYYEKEYVDFFSIHSSFITERLMRRIHSYGKEVHAWTVNTKNEIERMKRLGVDNIITDRPLLVREVLNQEEAGTGFIRLMQTLLRRK